MSFSPKFSIIEKKIAIWRYFARKRNTDWVFFFSFFFCCWVFTPSGLRSRWNWWSFTVIDLFGHHSPLLLQACSGVAAIAHKAAAKRTQEPCKRDFCSAFLPTSRQAKEPAIYPTDYAQDCPVSPHGWATLQELHWDLAHNQATFLPWFHLGFVIQVAVSLTPRISPFRSQTTACMIAG